MIHRNYVLSFAVPNLAAAGCVTAAGAVKGNATDLLWLAAVLLQQLAPVISSRITGDYERRPRTRSPRTSANWIPRTSSSATACC